MDRRELNIDLVFRNGLKDYEVLPPPEVWDNIHPAVKPKPRSFILLRSAATVAVLMTVSFLAYRLSLDLPSEFDSQGSSFDIAVAGPIFSSPGKSSQNEPVVVDNLIRISSPVNKVLVAYNEVPPEFITIPEIERSSAPAAADLKGEKSFGIGKRVSLPGSGISYKVNESLPLFFNEPVKDKPSKRWSIAAMASPTYYSKTNAPNSDLANQLLATEKPLISYTGGVAFGYKINKRLSVQSGLYYSSLGQKVDGISAFGGFQKYDESKGGHNFEVLTSSGTVFTNNSDVYLMALGSGGKVMTNITRDVFDPKQAKLQYIDNALIQNFSYLELPVLLKYKLVDKTVDINVIGGMSYNLLVNNSVTGGKMEVGKTDGLNLFSVSSSLGMGMEYSLSEKLSLNLEPTLRFYLNPFTSTISYRIHPYSFGIFSGLSYKF